MIRPATPTPDDADAILDLAVLAFGFGEEELDEVRASLPGRGADADRWLVDEDGGRVVGVAYVAPERMTRGTWNLYMLAVHPEHRRAGRAAALLTAVERHVRDDAGNPARLLLVETIPDDEAFAAANALYRKHGYAEAARLPEFYAEGTDKLIYLKKL